MLTAEDRPYDSAQSSELVDGRDHGRAQHIGLGRGVAVGDFCLVDGVNLYVATAVVAGSSTWRPIGGVPTTGTYGLGGKSYTPTGSSVFMLAGVTFSAVLDATPTTVTLTMIANTNWPVLPTVAQTSAHGFTVAGTSNAIAVGLTALNRGSFTINY